MSNSIKILQKSYLKQPSKVNALVRDSLYQKAAVALAAYKKNVAKNLFVSEAHDEEIIAKKMEKKGFTTVIIFPKSSDPQMSNRALYTLTVNQAVEVLRKDFPQAKNYKVMSISNAIKQGALKNVVESLKEEETEYQKFFQSALKKFDADSPADLDDAKKKEFFDYVDKNWKGKDESTSLKKKVGIKEDVLDDIASDIKGKSLMSLGQPLEKRFGKKNVDFVSDPFPTYMIKNKGKTIAILNKKHADDAEKIVGDLAIGYI